MPADKAVQVLSWKERVQIALEAAQGQETKKNQTSHNHICSCWLI